MTVLEIGQQRRDRRCAVGGGVDCLFDASCALVYEEEEVFGGAESALGGLLACCGGFVYTQCRVSRSIYTILQCIIYGFMFMFLELNVLQASIHNAGTRPPPFWRIRIPALLRQLIAAGR